jgi:hypothetical protein
MSGDWREFSPTLSRKIVAEDFTRLIKENTKKKLAMPAHQLQHKHAMSNSSQKINQFKTPSPNSFPYYHPNFSHMQS